MPDGPLGASHRDRARYLADHRRRPSHRRHAIREAARKLGQAANPLIVVGGGALDASAEVKTLAEILQAPVVAFRNGRGVLDNRHELSHTLPAGHVLWRDADVVLAIGTRLQPQQIQPGNRKSLLRKETLDV